MMKRNLISLLVVLSLMTITTQVFSEDVVIKWSDWSTNNPTSELNIQTKQQYRKRTKSTTSSTANSMAGWTLYNTGGYWNDWGSWSAWTPWVGYDSSDSRQAESATLYRYYYFECTNCGDHHPYHGIRCDTCGQSGTVHESSYKEYWSPTSVYSTSGGTWGGNKKWTYDFGPLYFWDSGNVVTATGARYRDRSYTTIYYYYKWSDWTSWQDTEMTASDTVEVEKQTLYRYQLTAAKPQIVTDERYNGVTVTLSTDTSNAKIYYTLDGTQPSKDSMAYTNPILLVEPVTLRAITVSDGMIDSEENTYTCDIDIGDLKYLTFDEQSQTITACSPEAENLIIPSKIGEIEVKNIGTRAFAGCDKLKSVALPNTVTQIETYAFYNCTELKYVDLKEGLVSINSGAFYGCTGIESIFIPDSAIDFGTGIFARGNENLTIDCYYESPAQLYAVDNNIKYNIITQGKVATPQITSEDTGGNKVLKITCDEEKAKIYYTLDGSTPTKNSLLYTDPVELPEGVTVKAIGIKNGMEDSDVATCDFNVKILYGDITGDGRVNNKDLVLMMQIMARYKLTLTSAQLEAADVYHDGKGPDGKDLTLLLQYLASPETIELGTIGGK